MQQSLLGLLVWGSCLTAVLAADPAPAEPPRYEVRELHDPNGIGKFYLGREIARVMGHQGIAWLERSNREEEERLSLLVKLLDLQPGMVVADIGAGSGVIAALMAPQVLPDGEILAVDIQPEMLDALVAKARLLGISNIVPVLGTEQSPRLPEESVDLAIMVDVYHEFDFPYEMLKEIAHSLKVGGRVAFVEYRKEDRRVPIKEVHKMSERQVQLEASQPGLNLVWKETRRELPWQHLIIFEKVAPGDLH